MTTKKVVDAVIYKTDGTREVIGYAEVNDEQNEVLVTITMSEIAEKLMTPMGPNYHSIGYDPTKQHNIFDKLEEKD